MPIVTLTTDFGTQDGYVGAMKGVILAIAPGARVVDITHEIPAQDVAAGAFALAQAAPYFPEGTIHVAVVDPGVGSARRAVVVDDGKQRYVGPDNGIFALAVPAPIGAWEITAPRFRRGTVAATFHGRNVFAPAAARLATGARAEDVGAQVELVGRLVEAVGGVRGGRGGAAKAGETVGHVVHVDRFGNLVTDVPAARLDPRARVRIAGKTITGLVATYADVARGRPLAYVGSAGTLEIGVRDGSAARIFKVRRGAPVVVKAPGLVGGAA